MRGRARTRFGFTADIGGSRSRRIRAAHLVGLALGVELSHADNTVRLAASLMPGLAMSATLRHINTHELEVAFSIGVDEAAAITRTRELAAAMNIGVDEAVLITQTLHIAAAMNIGVDEAAALTRTRELAAAFAIGAAQAAGITRTRQIAAANALGVAMATALSHAASVVPGSTTYDSGSGNYSVPAYNTLEIELWGGGASGNGIITSPSLQRVAGNNGGDSTVSTLSLTAQGGRGPAGGAATGTTAWPGGTGSVATGGDTNTSGVDGGSNATGSLQANSGAGGGSPNGGSGGAARALPAANQAATGNQGTAPGGGSSGGIYNANSTTGRGGAGGEGGAYCKKTYVFGVTPGAPSVGALLAYVVGAGGAVSTGSTVYGDTSSPAGQSGRIKFTIS